MKSRSVKFSLKVCSFYTQKASNMEKNVLQYQLITETVIR